jgi:hypothetical protein
MEPTVADGALLRLECGVRFEPGQVVALVHDGHVLVHRLVASSARALLTRGDALLVPDAPLVPPQAPFARVVAHGDGGAWHDLPPFRASAAQTVFLGVVRGALALALPAARGVIAAARRLRRAAPSGATIAAE